MCAYGDATTQVRDEAARTYITMAEETGAENLLRDLKALRQRASASLVADGIAEEDLETVYQADLRYTGQAYQITLDFSEQDLEREGILSLTRRFDAEHKHLFTFDLGEGHEIVMIRAIVKVRPGAMGPNSGPAGRRPGWKTARCRTAAIITRASGMTLSSMRGRDCMKGWSCRVPP